MKKHIEIDCECWRCHKVFTVICNRSDYNAWKLHGELIQDALPYLSDDERELLISSTCGKCWVKMFGPPFVDSD